MLHWLHRLFRRPDPDDLAAFEQAFAWNASPPPVDATGMDWCLCAHGGPPPDFVPLYGSDAPDAPPDPPVAPVPASSLSTQERHGARLSEVADLAPFFITLVDRALMVLVVLALCLLAVIVVIGVSS